MKSYPIGTLFIYIIPGLKYPRNNEQDLTIFELLGIQQLGTEKCYLLKCYYQEPDLMPEWSDKRVVLESQMKPYKVITQEIRDQIRLVNKAERKYNIEMYRLKELLK